MAYAKKTAIEEGLAEGRAEGLARGLAEGRAEGLAEGRIEGRAEGRIEGRAETIRQLLESGISLDVIAGALNLSPEEVEIFKDK